MQSAGPRQRGQGDARLKHGDGKHKQSDGKHKQGDGNHKQGDGKHKQSDGKESVGQKEPFRKMVLTCPLHILPEFRFSSALTTISLYL